MLGVQFSSSGFMQEIKVHTLQVPIKPLHARHRFSRIVP